jgi:hypothetical protein
MTISFARHDQLLIRDLYQESSENPYLDGGLSAFSQGRTADALCAMLSAFGRFNPCFLPRKGIIYFSVSIYRGPSLHA